MFKDVVLPGFGNELHLVQIVAHPCAMRTGSTLTPRITVAPVVPHQPVTGSGWDGNLRVMPLADLVQGQSFATKFVDVTAAPAELLTRDRRIATLTDRGIFVLQQRLMKHYTRVELALDLLRAQSAAVLTEAQMQWDWVEEALTEEELQDEAAVEREAQVFDTWLGQGTPSRRAKLRDEINFAAVRKEVHAAARDRAAERREVAGASGAGLVEEGS
ncbi:MAG: hypothetical protein WCF36_19370 [Candidatus Nanopelagicales bacterium]